MAHVLDLCSHGNFFHLQDLELGCQFSWLIFSTYYTRLTITEDSGPWSLAVPVLYGSVSLFGGYTFQPFWFCLESQILSLNMLGFSYSSRQSKITLIICFFFSQSAMLSAKLSQRPLHWFYCRFMLALISPRSYFSAKKEIHLLWNPSCISLEVMPDFSIP